MPQFNEIMDYIVHQHLRADGSLDHAKLRETIRIAVRALDDVIDINFYPTEPAATANGRHRPVGLGVMGLQYALYRRGIAFASPEGVAFSDEAFEAVAYYAQEASSDLAAERGTQLRERYRTAFQIEPEWLIDAAARRQKWIDQSQSLNLFLAAPDMKAMSHMYRRARHAGLKTTYYLRTLGEECEACQ